MRKILPYGLALLLGLTIAGCGPTQEQTRDYNHSRDIYRSCEKNLITNNRISTIEDYKKEAKEKGYIDLEKAYGKLLEKLKEDPNWVPEEGKSLLR